MKINIEYALEFFDNAKKNKCSKYSSAINGIVGEELAAFLYQHYKVNHDEAKKVEIYSNIPCKSDGAKSKVLDRWILLWNKKSELELYQTEIKNWSSNGIDGVSISFDATIDDINKVATNEFKRRWDSEKEDFKNDVVRKVFTKMNPDRLDIKTPYKHKALVIFWFPIYEKNVKKLLDGVTTVIKIKNNIAFNSIEIFSASTYLRYLLSVKVKEIEIESEDEYFSRYKKIKNHLCEIITHS